MAPCALTRAQQGAPRPTQTPRINVHECERRARGELTGGAHLGRAVARVPTQARLRRHLLRISLELAETKLDELRAQRFILTPESQMSESSSEPKDGLALTPRRGSHREENRGNHGAAFERKQAHAELARLVHSAAHSEARAMAAVTLSGVGAICAQEEQLLELRARIEAREENARAQIAAKDEEIAKAYAGNAGNARARPIALVLGGARTLNATGQSRVTLSPEAHERRREALHQPVLHLGNEKKRKDKALTAAI